MKLRILLLTCLMGPALQVPLRAAECPTYQSPWSSLRILDVSDITSPELVYQCLTTKAELENWKNNFGLNQWNNEVWNSPRFSRDVVEVKHGLTMAIYHCPPLLRTRCSIFAEIEASIFSLTTEKSLVGIYSGAVRMDSLDEPQRLEIARAMIEAATLDTLDKDLEVKTARQRLASVIAEHKAMDSRALGLERMQALDANKAIAEQAVTDKVNALQAAHRSIAAVRAFLATRRAVEIRYRKLFDEELVKKSQSLNLTTPSLRQLATATELNLSSF